MAVAFCLGFLFGALAIIVVEGLGFLFLLNRFNRKVEAAAASARESRPVGDLDCQQSLDFAFNKQGVVWILELSKIPKEQKRKKEILEVSPVQKYARIKDHSLILTESDGSNVTIPLKGCIISAVSATSLPRRKWAKKYPVKVENKTSVLYNGSKTFYIYFETSWEKESWCKALRLASFDDNEKIDRFVKLNDEFHNYLTSLNAGYPSFLKPLMGFYVEPVEKAIKVDGSSSKVRHFWKKISKKAPKSGTENKATSNSLLDLDDRKMSEKPRSLQDVVSLAGSMMSSLKDKNSTEESMILPSSAASFHAGIQSHVSVVPDAVVDDRIGIDEGTLCWNLLISRLFFDAKSSMEIIDSCQARIQSTLSNLRIPTYIGDIICTGIHTGNIPPYIHSMRVLPVDMNEVWAFEIDFEYSGGASLEIATRLEARDLDLQRGTVDTMSESTAVGEVTSDLLEELKIFRKQFTLPEGSSDALEQNDEADTRQEDVRGLKSTTSVSACNSRWKSIVNSVAKQVSQVPLSLAIKVASLRGTIRLHIKPPPSDQLWFGFTSMPHIDLQLESSVGEHKITSGRIAMLLANRFKAAIRDTVVLPNCEYVSIPWMLGEKNDWIPWSVAPFMWVKQEAVTDSATSRELPDCPSGEGKTKTEYKGSCQDEPESKCNKIKSIPGERDKLTSNDNVQTINKSSNVLAPSLGPTDPGIWNYKSSQELRTPLLDSSGTLGSSQQSRENEECSRSAGSDTLAEESGLIDEDDGKPKRMGRKARMLDLGKKMGEKLEEKRRHIEEKGRHIVEKMRGP